MRVLLTGGAGFIGSHTAIALAEHGHSPVVLDDLSNASPAAIERAGTLAGVEIPMVAGDVIVRSGCDVRISGMVAGDVYVEAGARARISGMVSGRIIDRGGSIQVSGMVGG